MQYKTKTLIDLSANLELESQKKSLENLAGKSIAELIQSNYNPNDVFIQESFNFQRPPTIVFVKNSITLEFVQNYSELTEFSISDDERKKVSAFIESKANDKRFYNGDHILLKDIFFDFINNTIYCAAERTDYATLSVLGNSIAKNFYYKTGVISPFITSDEKTFIFERNDALKLWSCASGFLQPINNTICDNLILQTAIKESNEEFLWNKDLQPQAAGIPVISQLSLRSFHHTDKVLPASPGTLEWIVPMILSQNSQEMKSIIEEKTAPDSHEHTNEYVEIDLNNLNSILNTWSSNKAGDFLYKPCIIAALIASSKLQCNEYLSTTKLTAENLATMLINQNESKYRLKIDTPHLSKIVLRILQTTTKEQQDKVLNKEIIEAALQVKDEASVEIQKLMNDHHSTWSELYCAMSTHNETALASQSQLA